MEHLFSTQLTITGQQKTYEVSFADEAYHFQPQDNEAPPIQLRRDQDEWQLNPETDKEVGRQAIDTLEKYLLAQH